MDGFDPQKYGELIQQVKNLDDYVKACCKEIKDDMQKINDEQSAAKTRTIATLVGVIITLTFLALTYFR